MNCLLQCLGKETILGGRIEETKCEEYLHPQKAQLDK
jgi:hypothetical protein